MMPLCQYYDIRDGTVQQSIAILKNLAKLKLDATASEVRTLSTDATIDAAVNAVEMVARKRSQGQERNITTCEVFQFA